jgi:RNA polymerase sigma factor (sigma-70 family)
VASSVVSIAAFRPRYLQRRDALVEGHLELVRQIAAQVKQSLPPSFDIEDLIGVGNLALVGAATRYRPRAHANTPFSAFARPIVRGAILDSVRRRHYIENTRPAIDSRREHDEEGWVMLKSLEPAVEPVIETIIDNRRLRRRLAHELAYLDPDQRTVLLAIYATGESDGRDSNEPELLRVVARRHGLKPWKVAAIRDQALASLRLRRSLA